MEPSQPFGDAPCPHCGCLLRFEPLDEGLRDAPDLRNAQFWQVRDPCLERGSDRTGVVVACHRVAQARWTAERAITEAMSLGMWRIEASKRAYIRDFSEKLSR